MERKPTIIIEHLEPEFGIWVFLEYRHSSLIYGREYIWFTNVPRVYHRVLKRYGTVYEESVIDLIERDVIKPSESLILDPQSPKHLSFQDLLRFKYIIVGGILGDHPPRGRTKKLLSDRLVNVETRCIGDQQYSIDGSVYFVNYLYVNKGLEGYSYVDGVELTKGNVSVYLPYRYPLKDGKPVIAEGLAEYLLDGELPKHILVELTENIVHNEKNDKPRTVEG